MNSFGVRAPWFAAAPVGSAAVWRAKAPTPPAAAAAIAKDGEYTGAHCPTHNLSSSLLPSASVSLTGGMLSLPLQVLRLTLRVSGGCDAHPLHHASTPASLSSSCLGGSFWQRRVAGYPCKSRCGCMWPTLLRMITKLMQQACFFFALCLSVSVHLFFLPFSFSQAALCYFSASASLSLSLCSVTILFFSSVAPHCLSICSLCLCSDHF